MKASPHIFANPRFQGVGVRIDGLSLVRGGRALFSGLNFAAEAGACVALRGPNGAGKTSLLRAIAGLLIPASGTITIAGEAGVHLISHRDGLKPSLDARAHLRFWQALLGGSDDIEAALKTVGLSRVADLPARALSQGQARRLALARLIACPRAIWLLDEPAAGLDAGGKAMLDDLLAAHLAQGGVAIAALHEPLGAAPGRVIELAGA